MDNKEIRFQNKQLHYHQVSDEELQAKLPLMTLDELVPLAQFSFYRRFISQDAGKFTHYVDCCELVPGDWYVVHTLDVQPSYAAAPTVKEYIRQCKGIQPVNSKVIEYLRLYNGAVYHALVEAGKIRAAAQSQAFHCSDDHWASSPQPADQRLQNWRKDFYDNSPQEIQKLLDLPTLKELRTVLTRKYIMNADQGCQYGLSVLFHLIGSARRVYHHTTVEELLKQATDNLELIYDLGQSQLLALAGIHSLDAEYKKVFQHQFEINDTMQKCYVEWLSNK